MKVKVTHAKPKNRVPFMNPVCSKSPPRFYERNAWTSTGNQRRAATTFEVSFRSAAMITVATRVPRVYAGLSVLSITSRPEFEIRRPNSIQKCRTMIDLWADQSRRITTKWMPNQNEIMISCLLSIRSCSSLIPRKQRRG